MAQRKYLNETGLSYFWGKIKNYFVKKSGDTMTGKLTLKSGQYSDAYNSGALDLQNSNIDGVNSIYTADASNNAQEGIHFYRDSTHVDSLHAKSGVLYFTPNRALGSAGTPNEVLIKGISIFPEAYLTWGGRDFSASYAPIDAAMISTLGANRFYFLKAAGISVEYSTDSGATWTDYGATDAQKVQLFAQGGGFYLGKHSAAGSRAIGDMLRVTISTGAAGVYTNLNKIAIYMSTQGNTVQVRIEKALESTPDTYTVHKDWTGIAGWSGWNILNMSGLTTYGNTAASQYGRVRFIFKHTAVTTGNHSSAGIWNIMGFGGVGWATPSTMAKTGHLYSFNENQDATFPAKVTASSFSGPLTGNVTGNVSGTAGSTQTLALSTALTADTIDSFHPDQFKIARVSGYTGVTLAGNDGTVIYVPWSSACGQQLLFDDGRNDRIYSRGYNQSTGWTAWRRITPPSATDNSSTGISIANHGTSSITGVSGSVTGSHVKSGGNGTAPTLGTAFTVPNVTAKGSGSFTQGSFSGGSFTQGTDSFTANTPTVIDTSKFSGGSFTRGTFSGGSGSFTQGSFSGGSGSFSATVSNHVMSFSHTHTAATHAADSHTHTAATHAADSFTAASLQSGFYTAGTAASFTQGTDSFSPATHAADSHTHTAPTLGTAFTIPNVTSVGAASNWVFEDVTVPKAASATTVVTGASHTITDNGHTHTLS